MRWIPLLVTAACMTDPNGDTCVWAPGNDGFCPSESESSGSRPKVRSYVAATGVGMADHVRIAMTRIETDEKPLIETTAVYRDVEPVHVPILRDGEPLRAVGPQLAAIDDVVYLTWSEASGAFGAPLVDDEVSEPVALGTQHGQLRRVGDRFLFVQASDGELRGVWIDRAGRRDPDRVLLATNVDSTVDISHDGGALAIAYSTRDTHRFVIVRIDPDGSRHEVIVPTLDKERVIQPQVTITRDRSVLAIARFFRESVSTMKLVRVAADGAVQVEPTTLPAMHDLVRRDDAILATNLVEGGLPDARIIDERGQVVGAPWKIDATHGLALFPTYDGFAAVHPTPQAPVALTWMPTGTRLPTAPIAETTVDDGCGCRSTNGGTAGLLVLAFALVLRRRVRGADRTSRNLRSA